MVKVCDRCRKEEGVEPIKFKGKTYELCKNCSGRVEKFLNETEKKGVLGNLFG